MLEKITIKNLAGFENYTAKFYPVTIIAGENESGKSSLLRVAASLFQGGSDNNLLRAGATDGSAEYLMSTGYRAVKSIHPSKGNGYTLKVFDPNGGTITSGAATMVKEWLDKETFDLRELMRMITLDPNALEEFILDNWPVKITPAELNPIVEPHGIIPRLTEAIDIKGLNRIYQTLYTQRTDISRDAKEAKAYLNTQEKALPAEGEDWKLVWETKEAELSAVEDRLSTVSREIQTEAEEARRSKKTEAAQKQSEILQTLRAFSALAERLCSAVGAAVSTRVVDSVVELFDSFSADIPKFLQSATAYQTIELSLTKDLESISAQERDAISSETMELGELKAKLAAETAVAREKAEEQMRSAGLREALENQRARLAGYTTKEALLTAALKDIERIKSAKVKGFPIPGLDVVAEGKKTIITVDGKPLSDSINTQKQMLIGVKFILEAQRRAGCSMRIIIGDAGTELDIKRLVEIADACRAEEAQLIISYRQDNMPLTVMSLDDFKKHRK